MRRLHAAAWLLAAACALSNACAPKEARRPGTEHELGAFARAPIILVSIDTLRADHLPAYGYRELETPNLDQLRKDSILYEKAFTPCPLTLPAHVSLMTGTLPPEHQVRNNIGYQFDGKSHTSLARLAKSHGYATGAAVSSYVLRRGTGLADSFDFFDDSIEKPQDAIAASRVQRAGGETARRALEWLAGAGSGPFFLFLHLYEPHAPYDPPEPFRSRYPLAYDGEIAAADAIMGDFVNELKRRGLYDRALIVLLSDHGEGLGDHGEEEHGILLYREALHVPLLVKLPGSKRAGTTVTRPVSLIDVLPTVTGALGLTPPEKVPGVSLLDSVSGRAAEGRRIYSETYYPRIHLGWSELRSLWDGRYHFIDAPRPELYDTEKDPQEMKDLFSRDSDISRSWKRELNAYAPKFALPSEVAPEDLKKLAALGYLSVTTPAAADGPLPNPADQIAVLPRIGEGLRLAAAGHGDRAVAVFRKLLDENSRLFDVQYQLAETLARLKRYEEAAEEYKRALRLSPSLAGEIALALGRVSLELGRLQEAEVNAGIAMRSNPPEAHELLARLALSRNDVAAVEREAGLVTGSPTYELNAAVLLAEARLRRNEVAQALAVLDRAIARVQKEKLSAVGNLHFLRGDALARLSRYAQAEAAFKEEIRLFPRNSQAYARLAILYALEHRTVSEVYRVLEAMGRANPTPETSLLAATTLESIGDPQGAAAWRRRAGAPESRKRGR